MRIMERAEREGKQVTSFVSWCGGLPEASASNVPLAYKFSWSPKAVLTASGNPAHFKLNNEVGCALTYGLSRWFEPPTTWSMF